MGVELEGFDKLIKTLEGMSGEWVAKKSVLDGLEIAGMKIVETAKDRCPRNSGSLKDDIVSNREDDCIIITTNEYAFYVEYGTGYLGDPSVNHTTRKRWFVPSEDIDPKNGIPERDAERYHFPVVDTKKGKFYIVSPQEPQPFLYPALQTHIPTIKTKVEEALREAIRKAGG